MLLSSVLLFRHSQREEGREQWEAIAMGVSATVRNVALMSND